MAEPFKNFFRREVVENMAAHLRRVHGEFDAGGFVAASCDGLEELELKQRADHIADALTLHLPADLTDACDVLLASLAPEQACLEPSSGDNSLRRDGVAGWAVMPMTHYVARHGLDRPNVALPTLYEMTKRFTAEGDIRPFLVTHPDQTLAALAEWIGDENHHVRRLVSEGTRPRLPWSMRLEQFIKDPEPVIALLHRLRDDPSDYVRRSVANNLNDISKDHPDRVAALVADWLTDAPPEREKLLRHACRSLIKAGHQGCLDAFGYGPLQITVAPVEVLTPRVILGGALEFCLTVTSTAVRSQNLLLDYVVHHRKANGSTSPKVFKWKTCTLAAGETLHLRRRHPIRPITTRTYYDGPHAVGVKVNGTDYPIAPFELSTGDPA